MARSAAGGTGRQFRRSDRRDDHPVVAVSGLRQMPIAVGLEGDCPQKPSGSVQRVPGDGAIPWGAGSREGSGGR